MFRKMPFILLAVIIGSSLLQPLLPLELKSALFALSLSLKEAIVFALPFLIFGLLFKTAVQFSKIAQKMVLFLLLAIIFSNFTSTLLSYTVGSFAYTLELSMGNSQGVTPLAPMWQLPLPKIVGNDVAMFSGLILGLILGRFLPSASTKLSTWLENLIGKLLKAILYAIPAFILGFVIKMNHDQMMAHIIRNYSIIFVLVATAVFTYIAFIYLVANSFNVRRCLQSIQNMFPAAIVGFGSMSSAAAMPLTILGAEKNSSNPDLARSIIPATVNVHLIGDCFAIPIFAFAVMKNFGAAEPAFFSYLIFAAYFVLAKFSVAAVPGGGILVMLPILDTTLGFNAEMLSLITTLYILFDPIITCANVMGNGAFAQLLTRFGTAKHSLECANVQVPTSSEI